MEPTLLLGDTDQIETELRIADSVISRSSNAPLRANMAYVYRRIGLDEDADRFLSEFEQIASERHVAAGAKVVASLARGDEEQALSWLEATVERAPYDGYNIVHVLKANLWNDPVLNRPEFAELRNQLAYTDL